MIADIVTLIWKEWKELFLQRSGRRGGLMNVAITLGLLGVFMPLQTGPDWLVNPVAPLVWVWLPVFLALNIIADAIAGERERHTLETLLASRLSDKAILFGKLGAAVLYGWGMAVAGLVLAAVTINVAYPAGGFRFYRPELLAGALALSFLAGLLISSLGVFVSLRAATARQAYQRLSMVMLGVWFLPMLAAQFLPDELLRRIFGSLSGLNIPQVMLWAAVGLAVINAGVLALLTARFERTRLMETIE
jgi:ABC-2 type transport system permease protein